MAQTFIGFALTCGAGTSFVLHDCSSNCVSRSLRFCNPLLEADMVLTWRLQEGAFSTPQLYIPGQQNQPFSWRVLSTWLASAVWNSAVCFYVPVWALAPAAVSSTGLMIDIWATGTLGYTLIIVTVCAAHAVLPS